MWQFKKSYSCRQNSRMSRTSEFKDSDFCPLSLCPGVHDTVGRELYSLLKYLSMRCSNLWMARRGLIEGLHPLLLCSDFFFFFLCFSFFFKRYLVLLKAKKLGSCQLGHYYHKNKCTECSKKHTVVQPHNSFNRETLDLANLTAILKYLSGKYTFSVSCQSNMPSHLLERAWKIITSQKCSLWVKVINGWNGKGADFIIQPQPFPLSMP